MKVEKIEFKNVTYAYISGSDVITDISLTIHNQETIFVFGNSGGGKTTFLKLAEGLIAPTKGDIIINDVFSIKKASKAELMNYHSHSAFIFQDSGLLNNMNVYDNLALPLRYRTDKSEIEIKEMIIPVMQEMGILKNKHHFPGQLSRAEKKLVSIARAIIINPQMYIYDFPFEGLDYMFMNKIKTVILKQKENNVSLLLADNHLDFALNIANRILVLYDGRVLFFDKPQQLKYEQHPFIQDLLENKRQ